MESHLLDREMETYQRLVPQLVGSEGKWVAIHGERLLGIFDSYALALQAAYTEFGLDQHFMVKKVDLNEVPLLVTRLVAPCRS